jgi:hypothetical protein
MVNEDQIVRSVGQRSCLFGSRILRCLVFLRILFVWLNVRVFGSRIDIRNLGRWGRGVEGILGRDDGLEPRIIPAKEIWMFIAHVTRPTNFFIFFLRQSAVVLAREKLAKKLPKRRRGALY